MGLSWKSMQNSLTGYSRRDLFRRGGLLAAAQALGPYEPRAAATPLSIGPDLYRSIGVRPLINAHGTFAIITGSQTLPEVKLAMDQASRSYRQSGDARWDGITPAPVRKSDPLH